MRFNIHMKTPDAMEYACEEAATSWNEVEGVIDRDQAEDLMELCSKWFKYRECITLEVDTEAQTIRVLPARD